MSQENPAIIIDAGSGTTKIGFSNEEAPKLFYSSIVGTPKENHGMVGSELEEFYIGDQALEKRSLLKFNYPIQNGLIQNKEDTLRLWEKAIHYELQVETENHPLLLTENILTDKSNRETMAQIAFESLKVPQFVVCSTSLLCLYGCGNTTGLVVESGEGITSTLPVYQGYPFYKSALKSNVAGQDCTNYLSQLLLELGVDLTNDMDREIVREMKEESCFVKLESNYKQNTNTFVLPDGSVISFTDQQSRCPEILFRPYLAGITALGLHYQINKSIDSCDLTIKKQLYENIILAGGNTLFPNFSERLKQEMTKIKPNTTIKITASPERRVLPWVGAQVLCQLQSFSQFWISKAEYDESGTDVVNKCIM